MNTSTTISVVAAGIVVAIGPRLFKAANDLLLGTSPKPYILQLDPGIDHVTQREELPSRLLVLITGRMEDAPLKGLPQSRRESCRCLHRLGLLRKSIAGRRLSWGRLEGGRVDRVDWYT